MGVPRFTFRKGFPRGSKIRKQTLYLLGSLMGQYFAPRHNTRIRALGRKILAGRIVLNPDEKAELLRLVSEIGRDVGAVLAIAQLPTYRRRLSNARRGALDTCGREACYSWRFPTKSFQVLAVEDLLSQTVLGVIVVVAGLKADAGIAADDVKKGFRQRDLLLQGCRSFRSGQRRALPSP